MAACLSVGACSAMAQDYRGSVRAWSDGPVRLSEFQGHADSDTLMYNMSWYYLTDNATRKVGNIKYIYRNWNTYADMTESWVHPEYRNDTTELFCQTSFNLVELFGRKATVAFMHDTDADYTLLSRFYINQLQHRHDELEKKTEKGRNYELLQQYSADILAELDSIVIDPSQVPLGEPGMMLDMSVGLSSVFPFSSYYSPCAGLSYTMGIGYKRHIWSLDLDFNFAGECKRDFRTDKEWIDEGDDLNNLYFMTFYGYRLNPKSWYAFYPMIGLGVSSLTVPIKGAIGGNNEEAKIVDAFSIGAGFRFDIPINRTVYLNNYILRYKTMVNTNGIRLFPFVSVSDIPGELGWQPSLNLSVVYYWSSTGLRYHRGISPLKSF